MEEDMQHIWHIMLYYFKSSRNTTETPKKKRIYAVYGEGTVTDPMCQKWFAKFHTGDFLLENAPQSGRPVEVDSNHIKAFTENNQRYTSWKIASIFRRSKSIKLLVKMKNVSFILLKKIH